MASTTVPDGGAQERRFARLVHRVAALEDHGRAALVLVIATIAGALFLDVAFPSYPIAGFYLIPVTIAALTQRVRVTIAVSAVCLVLAVYVLVIQDRTDGPTITVVCFSVLSGAGLIALSYLFKQVDQLYATERLTTARLESLAEQLQTLQEVAVLDSDQPAAELLERFIEQASALLGSDGCRLYRLDPEAGELVLAVCAGAVPRPAGEIPLSATEDPEMRALRGRRPAVSGDGALLAVPLFVRDRPYGVLSLAYREPRSFSDLDVRLAASLGGQVALALENARLRDELQQNAAADERSRIARDLHDSVTQSLFAASLKAEAVRRRWRPDSAEGRRTVEDLERLSRGALAEMRTLLLEMRPGTIAEAPLPALLEQLVEATRGRTRIAVDLDVTGSGQLPPDVVVALYRIAQEALHNLEHHSGAGRAWVMLDVSDVSARLEVGDDGQGFDAAEVTREHLGLSIMRETADAAGVQVTVDSAPDRGTLVTGLWHQEEVDGDG